MESKTLVNGLTWSFAEKISVILLQIILEIIFARLLLPSDYGVLGMIMVVVAFANVFVDGGLSSALIHYKNRKSQDDYSTVFYTSIFIGIFSYLIIYFLAPYISKYYNKDVTTLIRVISIVVLCNSFGIIYRTRLSIDMNFKKQTVLSMIAMVVSGGIGIYMAYVGFGVWALVTQLLIFNFLYNFFLFCTYKKIPKWIISKDSLDRIFGFGFKIFISSVIHAVYFNAYPILMGRFYSPYIVGLYTKANQFTTYPAGIFSSTVQRVFFPYLVNFQKEREKVYELNQKFIKTYCLLSFPIVTWAVFFAKPIIIFVLSSNWIEMVLPFQILLVASVFFPIIILNMNIFQIIGKANLFLYTEILTKIVGITILVLTYNYGFIYICLGILLQIIIQFIITSVITGKILGVSVFNQIINVALLSAINVIMFLIAFYLKPIIQSNLLIVLIIILSLVYILILYLMFRKDLFYIRDFVYSKILKR